MGKSVNDLVLLLKALLNRKYYETLRLEERDPEILIKEFDE
jgi:hypothetical protein